MLGRIVVPLRARRPWTADSNAKEEAVDIKFFRSDNRSFDGGVNFSFDAGHHFWNVLKEGCSGGRAVVIPTFPDLLPITACSSSEFEVPRGWVTCRITK